ncbi:hypothetical protein NE865_03214 [Phthorimaea operculella]|nr:hypothetical protein NE865_03214 [Phthorimaea operculella]
MASFRKMKSTQVLSCFILIGLVTEVWSHIEMESEDYFFPLEPVINYCQLSEQCQHDYINICGKDSLGITRLFIDYCDMYEYNCDDKKQYRHVLNKDCDYKFVAAEIYEKGYDGIAK